MVLFFYPDKIVNLFYNDAFYYFTIATNYLHKGVFSFDGINPTNGFHPLWQIITIVLFKIASNSDFKIILTLLVCIVLTSSANILFFSSAYKITKSKLLAFITIIPGYFYLIFGLAIGKHYSIISPVNGMETSISLFLFSLLLYFLIRCSEGKQFYRFKYYTISLLVSLLFLSRLDEIFIIYTLLLYVFFSSDKSNRLLNSIKFLVFPILMISGYLIYNQLSTGMLLPVSGLQKSGFSFDNVVHIIRGLFLGRSFNYFWGEHLYSRILPIVYVLIATGFFLVLFFKKSFNKNNSLIAPLAYIAMASILKLTYHIFFTNLWDQGQWYYNIDIITSNIIVAYFIITRYPSILKIKYISIYSAILILCVLFWNAFANLTTETRNEMLWRNREKIKNEIIKIDKFPKIIEMDDGIVTYALGFRALSGFGLCMDKEAFKAKNSGKLFDLAYKRGYRYIASLNYFKNPDNIPNTLNNYKDFVSIPFFALEKQDLDFWQFQSIYSNNLTGFVLIKFEKK